VSAENYNLKAMTPFGLAIGPRIQVTMKYWKEPIGSTIPQGGLIGCYEMNGNRDSFRQLASHRGFPNLSRSSENLDEPSGLLNAL
jgi:hypothetical protein